MDSHAFSEDAAEVRQIRLAHSDDSSEDEEPDRFMNEPHRFINIIEVLIILQFNTQLTYNQGSAVGPGSQRDPIPGIDFWTRDRDRDRLLKTGTGLTSGRD